VEERYEDDHASTKKTFPLLFGVRSVMLAYERRALISRAMRSGGGTVVLSDRYPSDTSGAPDGPQLAHLPMPSGRFSVRRVLARLEGRLYRDIPAPDLVFHLTAPLEVTLARNAARDKREPEDYVRFRHALSSRLRFDGAPVFPIDTDRDLALVVQEIEGVIGDRRATAR
jgi:thymidylate kinase